MPHPVDGPNKNDMANDATTDLQKSVLNIIERSNRVVSRQPEQVQRAMSSYLEPERDVPKPWETWL